MIKEYGLYLIKNSFYTDFPNSFWSQNKGVRPNFMVIKDSDGIFWMIPLSTQVDSYKKKIEKYEERYGKGNCVFYHLGLIAGEQRVFLISNMVPVTEEYIERAYTISGIEYISATKSLNQALKRKAIKYQALVKSGHVKDDRKTFEVKEKLLRLRDNEPYRV